MNHVLAQNDTILFDVVRNDANYKCMYDSFCAALPRKRMFTAQKAVRKVKELHQFSKYHVANCRQK